MKMGGVQLLDLIYVTSTVLLFQIWCVSALQSPVECSPFNYPSTIGASAESSCWATEQNLGDHHALTHSLFRDVAHHLRSSTTPDGSRSSCLPFLRRRDANSDTPIIEFTCDDLESAVACDYLVASTGRNVVSTTKQGGWRMDDLEASGSSQSFQSKRLDWKSVLNAQNTVVFNSAGAYISSQLAPTALAALDGLNGAATGVCLNLYVTKADIQQSAPPHSDKQDVVVIQTQGRKRWRVFSPPNCALKYNTDPFCRGKGEDELTVPMLSNEGSELLLDVTLSPGDILFVPARFPHTTDTLNCYDDIDCDGGINKERIFGKEDWSMHLTVGLDSHVWAMNSMSMRTLALRRFGVHDILKSTAYNADPDRNMDHCVGKVNQLSFDLREGLFSSLDETLFSPQRHQQHYGQILEQNIARVAANLLSFHERTNFECSWVDVENILTLDQCVETVTQFSAIGKEIMNAHKDMYIAALEEEIQRGNEEGGWAQHVGHRMAKENMDRLSIFRVPIYFEQFDQLREDLRTWGDYMGDQNERSRTRTKSLRMLAPLPFLINGDQVTANLGILGDNTNPLTWTSANILEVRPDGLFNLVLFDGMVEEGVSRHDIKGPHGIGIFI